MLFQLLPLNIAPVCTHLVSFRQGWASVGAESDRLERLEADVQRWRETCTRTNAQVRSDDASDCFVHFLDLLLRNVLSMCPSLVGVGAVLFMFPSASIH